MLLIRHQTVVNLPLTSIIVALLIGLLLGAELRSGTSSTGTLATIAGIELLFVIMAAMQFRVTRRVGDELRVYGLVFLPERSPAAELRLRASISGTRSPVLDVELVRSKQPLGTSVAILGASAKGRKRAEAVAEALRLPLTGDLPEPEPPAA